MKNKKRLCAILAFAVLLLALPTIQLMLRGVPFVQAFCCWFTVYALGALVLWSRVKLQF